MMVARIGVATAGLFAALIVFAGCDFKWVGIPGSGQIQSEDREVGEYSKLDVSGIGTINVAFGDTPSLKVSCDNNLLELVETKVVDGQLRISCKGHISPTELRFDIVTKSLSSVEIGGAATLNLRGAKLDSLGISVNGASVLNADGIVEKLEIELSGAGKIDTNQLLAKHLKLVISGAGKADVYASESFDAQVSGAALVNCLGQPKQVTKNLSGAGRINVVE